MSNNKQKRNKPTKEELYKNEREQFIQELNDLIQLDKNKIYFHIINNDNNLQLFIDNNEYKIKKYFKFGKWSYFINQDKNKRELGTLIKNIYKSQKFTIHSKSVNITVNNKSIGTKQLFFYKDGDVIHFSD
jgi:hypothetical protein